MNLYSCATESISNEFQAIVGVVNRFIPASYSETFTGFVDTIGNVATIANRTIPCGPNAVIPPTIKEVSLSVVSTCSLLPSCFVPERLTLVTALVLPTLLICGGVYGLYTQLGKDLPPDIETAIPPVTEITEDPFQPHCDRKDGG